MTALSFKGTGFEYFKIWIVNILLTLITLGLYYPWAKVRNNRYFYGNTTLENRNFDYHATGKQLFIGYLIAMSIFIVYVIIQQVSPVLGLVALLAFLLALPWIIWRSLKFNMRVTSFSNVRFGFDGAVGGAYLVYMLMPILALIGIYSPFILIAIIVPMFQGSLGFVGGLLIAFLFVAGLGLGFYMYGLLQQKTASYVINHSRYGQGKFATKIKAGEFAMIAAKTFGLFLISGFLYLIAIALIAMLSGLGNELLGLAGDLDNQEAIADALAGGLVFLIVLVYLGFIFISVAIFAYSFTRQRAYIFARSKLDGKIRLRSTLKARKMAFISITNFLLIIVTLGLAIPWAKVRLTRYIVDGTQVDTSLGLDEYVTQQEKEQSSLGEQIGDAFDVDVGLGF